MEGIPNERLEGCLHGFVVDRLLKLVEKQENGKVPAFRTGHELCYECYWIFPLVAAGAAAAVEMGQEGCQKRCEAREVFVWAPAAPALDLGLVWSNTKQYKARGVAAWGEGFSIHINPLL